MANSVKLLNYVEIEGEYLRFYSELDSSLEIGDKVFIVGGSYDNTVYTTPEHVKYDPYNEFAMGYTVLSIDSTSNSNAVTLNIKYSYSTFSSGGIESLIIKPTSVYPSTEDLIADPNQLREAYLTPAYFRRGDFNGGTFDGGMLGEFNRLGNSISADLPYQRQYATDAYIDTLTAAGETEEADKLKDIDFGIYETPVNEYTSVFNNKPENNPAIFSNGIIAGTKWQWGSWKTKYSSKKVGKKQVYSEYGLNTSLFTDNNGGKGYSAFASGSVGKIYHNLNYKHTVAITTTQNGAELSLDFIPYELKQAVLNNFNTFIKIVDSVKNNYVYSITAITNNKIILSNTYTTSSGKTQAVLLVNEQLDSHVEVYVSDSTNKPNRLKNGVFTSVDWFGGVADNAFIQGGKFYNGESINSSIGSIYERFNWYGGYAESSLAENVRWYNGTWFSGQWRGDSVVSMLSYAIDAEAQTLSVTIPTIYAHLFEKGEYAFISYVKKSLNNEYVNNYTDLPNNNLLNFQEFLIESVDQSTIIHAQTVLTLKGKVDSILNVNLSYAKISQSFFKKGLWVDGVWESGLRSVNSSTIDSSKLITIDNTTVSITLEGIGVNDFNTYRLGDRCTVSNIATVFKINGLLLEELSYNEKVYKKPIHEVGVIVSIDSSTNTIKILFPDTIKTLDSDLHVSYGSPSIGLVDEEYPLSLLTTAVWLDGDFRSGVWKGGIWNNGLFRSKLYFDLTNTQAQSIWTSGYWKNGTLNGGAFISGVWENGTVKDGVITNLYNNANNNTAGKWSKGDTFWLDGIFEKGKWRGGVWKKGYMLDGTILNGGIENIVWQKGVYDNGNGLYDSAINSNRSGLFKSERSLYDNLSAPSILYVDGNGWVQLDQPSLYQQGYSVIFQDLSSIKNPFNNQLFTIRDRDQFGARVKIDYANSSTSDNPLYDTDIFSNHKPLVAADNIADVCELEYSNESHLIWFTDKGHQRIMEVDLIKNTVDCLGIVINNSRSEIYKFTDISKLSSAYTSLYVYVIDNNKLTRISKAKNTTDLSKPEREIDSISLPISNGENLIDLWIKPASSTSPETMFVVSDLGKLYTKSVDAETFTTVSLPLTVTPSNTTCVTYCKADGSNTVHAFIYTKLNDSTLTHLVLDYNLSDKSYGLRTNGVYSLSAILNTNNVISLASTYDADLNQMRIWVASENNVSVINYHSFFTGSQNTIKLLNNDNNLDYPLSTIKFGFDKSYLMVVGKDSDNYPSVIATAKIGKFTTGFANKNSALSLMNIHQDLQQTDNREFYYYDVSKSPLIKRLIRVNPVLSSQYSPENDVDVLDTDEEAIKMINGGNDGEIFTVIRKTTSNTYFIRHTIFGAEGSITSYSINANNVVISDISFCRNNLFVAYTCDVANKNVVRIAAFNDFTASTTLQVLDPAKIRYATLDLGINGSVGNMYLDVIENRDTFLAVLYKANKGFYQLIIDNTSIASKKLYDSTDRPVRDISLASNGTVFSLFISYDTQVLKTVTDTTFSENNVTFFKWSDLLDIRGYNQKVDNDVVFNGKSITEIYRTTDSRRLVIKNGYRFSVINTVYDTNKVDVNISEFTPVSSTSGYALTNQTLVKVSGNSTDFDKITAIGIGNYKQRNRLAITDISDPGVSLNEPFALTYAPAFNDAGNDYLFFIDNTSEIDQLTKGYKKCIRYYNIVTADYGVAKPVSSLAGLIIRDLSYLAATKEMYVIYDTYSFGDITTSLMKFKWSGGEIYDVDAVSSLSKGYSKISIISLNSRLCAFATTLNSRQVDLIVDINNLVPSVTTIVSGVKIKDVACSLAGDGNLHVYYTSNGLVYYNQVSASNVSNLSQLANGFNALGEFDSVLSITESPLLLNGSTRGIVINNNGTQLVKAVANNTQGQSFSVSNFAYSPSSSVVYLYNSSTSTGNGLLRQEFTSDSPIIDLRMSNMIATPISAGGYKKTAAVSDTIAYALFDNGLYKYNYVSKRVSIVSLDTIKVEYRDANEAIPSVITSYHYKPVDISYYTYSESNVIKTDLVIIAELYNNTQSTGCFDVFLYNGSAFSKDKIKFLYGGLSNIDAIKNDGSVDSTRLAGDLVTGKGGIKHLFKSVTPPTISTIDGAFYLEFTSNNTRNLTKVSADYLNNEFYPTASSNELVYRVALHDRDFAVADIKGVSLISNNKTIAYSSQIVKDTFMVDADDVLLDKPTYFVASFLRNSSILIQDATSYAIKIHFTKGGNQASSKLFALYKDLTDADTGLVTKTYDVIYESQAPICLFPGKASVYYTLSNNKLTPSTVDTITPEYNINSPALLTKDITWNLANFSKDNHSHILQNYDLAEFVNKYGFTTLLNGYRVTNINASSSGQVLSPYLTSRVLVDTHINKGVSFNKGGTAYTAHLVSGIWKNNDFIGSWDAPYYRNNLVIEKSSYFISGTFTGVFYDGYFLGGTFKNADTTSTKSTVLQGHFISESEDINFVSGQVDSPYRYDIDEVKFSTDAIAGKDYLSLNVLAYELQNGAYKASVSDTLTKGRVVNIPVLFKEKALTILEVIKPDKKIYSNNIILLKVDKTDFINLDITIGYNVFIRCNEYTEYLFGFKEVVDTYTYGAYAFIAVESEFSNFTNGSYTPLTNPSITLNQYHIIADNTLTKLADGTYSNNLLIEVAIPDSITNVTDKIKYIQKVYLNDSVQIMYSGDYTGYVSIPNYLQLFTLSFSKGFYNSIIDITSTLEHVYLRDVTSADYTSRVSINLGTLPSTAFASGIMVNNSYITTPSARKSDWIERSVVLSGKTDRNWKNGAWLNIDEKGFTNASSSFGDDNSTMTFEGEYTTIVDIFFDTDEYIWVELSDALASLRINDYILLRGFTGNKAILLGAERSQSFRVIDIDNTFVKIKNPFKYFNNIGTNNPLIKDFNKDYLQVRKQSMLVKDVVGTPDINSIDKELVFNYGVASVSGYNGGNFKGDFSSVWNAGKFDAGNFSGKWFGSPESTSWNGYVNVVSSVATNGFSLDINLNNATVLAGDLIYISFHQLVVNNKLRTVTSGFYATVKDASGVKKINTFVTTALRSGSYPVTITRYRTGYDTVQNNQLVTDFNSNNSKITTAYDHSIMPYSLSINENGTLSNENKALLFTGDNGISISDVLNTAKLSGNPSQFSTDLWFTVDDVQINSTNEQAKPLFSFQRSDDDSLPGTKLYIQNQTLTFEYEDLLTNTITSVVLFDSIVTSRWYHVGLFYSNGLLRATLYDQDYNNSLVNSLAVLPNINKCDICYIGKTINKVGVVNESLSLSGRMDEIRFWSIDMFDYFCDLSNTSNNRVNSLFNKRIMNSYIPELVAYFNAENSIDTADLYPEEELTININSANKQTYFVSKETEKNVSISGKDIILHGQYFVDNNGTYVGDTAYRKIYTIQEVINTTTAGSATSASTQFNLELLVTPTQGDKFSIRLRESVISTGKTSAYRTIADFESDELRFWQWLNIDLTHSTLYVNGVAIGNFVCTYRNLLRNPKNAQIIFGKYDLVLDSDDLADAINVSNEANVLLRDVAVFESESNDLNYIIHRIKSGEGTSRLTQSTFTASNSEISSDSHDNIIIPNIVNGVPDSALLTQFNPTDYQYDIRGNLKKTPVSSTTLKLANPTIWNTALPQSTWLLDKTVNEFKKADFSTANYIAVTISSMQAFTYFGKKVADTNGTVSLVIHKNGYIILTTQLTDVLDTIDKPELIANGLGNSIFSSADIIQVLHTPLTYTTDAFVKYADRTNEFVLKLFVPAGTGYSVADGVYSFIALRIDKVSSAITFYNRMIREVGGVTTKYQGLRRGDGYTSTMRDYYKNALDNDFTVGYSGSTSNTLYSEYTEYVVYTPAYNFSVSEANVANAVKAMFEQRLDNVKELGFKKLYSLLDSNNGIQYAVVQDMPVTLTPVYVNDLSSIVSYDNIVDTVNKINITEQYNTSQEIISVSRDSTFAGGTFSASVWHNGIMTGGVISSNGTIWKNGIKYGGDIKSATLYRRLSAEWFVSEDVALLYDADALGKKCVLADKKNAKLIKSITTSLSAGSYKLIFRMKSTVASSSTDTLATIILSTTDNSSNQVFEIANRTIRPVDFTFINQYDLIDVDITLDKDYENINLSMLLNVAGLTISLDYVDIMKQSEYGTYTSPAYTHWLGGFHMVTSDSSVSDIIWYRGVWNNGVWKRGHWFSLNLDNEYKSYVENIQTTVINDDWSVWNGGTMRADSLVEHDSSAVYALAVQASVWHGGTWKSEIMSNQKYTYANTEFANHVVRNGNIVQLPKINSTWLGGQWLRGKWEGGIFANGFWHSVNTEPATFVSSYDFDTNSLESTSFVSRVTDIKKYNESYYGVGYNGLITVKSELSWEVIESNVSNDLYAMDINSDGVAIVVGEKGLILRSTDFTIWTPIAWSSGNLDDIELYDVLFIDDKVAYICGVNTLLKTIDGGISWNRTGNSTYTLKSLTHVAGNLVYGCGDAAKIVSNNGNDNWTFVNLSIDVLADIIKIEFTSVQVGYALTRNGNILKTTNGGSVWSTIKLALPNITLIGNTMAFLNDYTGYVIVGTNDLKLYTTYDGGNTWKATAINNPVRNPYLYLNKETEDIYIGGDNGRILFAKGAHKYSYTDNVGYHHDDDSSYWESGMMINSIWEGGTVEYSPDVLNTVFGDIITQYSVVSNDVTNKDFVWSKDSTNYTTNENVVSRGMQLKRSDVFTGNIYKTIFGQEYFVGYHNGTETDLNKLEYKRVMSQFNEDGIMSVYWKRGKWHGGLFQFSHWSNQDLNSNEINTMSVNNNSSEFDGGYFYSSYWKGGKWYNLPSTNDYYKFNDVLQPNSLFYKSQWESGYWKSGKDNIGLITDDLNDGDLRITNGLFIKSIWSAGVYEGGIVESSIVRSGVVDSGRKIEYKGSVVELKPAVSTTDQTLAISFDDDNPYPNFDVIGRLNNTSDGSVSTLTNPSVKITAQPTIINNKKYVLNKNNTISVYNQDGTLKVNLRLDFQEIYGEIFNTTSGSNIGENVPNNLVTSLTQQGNILWVGTDNGLWKIDIVSKVSKIQLTNIRVNCLYSTSSMVWVGLSSGVWSYSVSDSSISVYTTNVSGYTGDGLPDNNVTCIHGNDTTIFAGTNAGIWSLTVATKVAKVVNQTNFPYTGTAMPSNNIKALYYTGSNIWVGTDAGLWLLNLDITPYIAQLFDVANTDGYASGVQLPSNNITSITNYGNTMWIGTVAGLWKITRQ